MRLVDILKATANRMDSDFEAITGALGSAVDKGRAREDSVREFLKLYLSPRFGVEAGELTDCHGNLTGELDVIVYDREEAPPLFSSPSVRVIPCESARAIVEVKSVLDPSGVKEDAGKIQRAKALSRQLPEPSIHMPLEGLERHDWPPVLGGLFAFDSSVTLSRLGTEICQWNESVPAEQRVDFLLVLRRGKVTFGPEDEEVPGLYYPRSELDRTGFEQECRPPKILLVLSMFVHLRLAEFDAFAGRPPSLVFFDYLLQALRDMDPFPSAEDS